MQFWLPCSSLLHFHLNDWKEMFLLIKCQHITSVHFSKIREEHIIESTRAPEIASSGAYYMYRAESFPSLSKRL